MKKENEQQDRTPESVTDAELDDPKMIADLERDYASKHLRIITASAEASRKSMFATSKQDLFQARAALQATLRDAKSEQASLSAWCDRLAERTSNNFKSLQEAFVGLVADIQNAVGGDLPGQEPTQYFDPDDDDDKEPWQQ